MFDFQNYVSIEKGSWIDKIMDINSPAKIIGEYAGAHASIEFGNYYGVNRVYWITVNANHFYSGKREYLVTVMGGKIGNIHSIDSFHVGSMQEAYKLYKTLIEKYSK